jgi:hypothetical protein
MQLLDILWFFNQIIVVINQKSFNFQTILYTCIMCVIKVQIIGPIYNHCDDLIKVFICKHHCCKVVNVEARLNIFFVSIYHLGMPRICLAKDAMFENYLSW